MEGTQCPQEEAKAKDLQILMMEAGFPLLEGTQCPPEEAKE